MEEFGLGIDAGSVEGGVDPGVADLDGAVVEVEVDVAGAADDFVGGFRGLGFENCYPRHAGACGFELEGGFGPGAEVLRGFYGGEHIAPDLRGSGAEGYLLERWEVGEREGFKADAGAFEGWGGHGIILMDFQ